MTTLLASPLPNHHSCAACLGKKFQPTPVTELNFESAFGIPRPPHPIEEQRIEMIDKQIKSITATQYEQQLMSDLLTWGSK